MTKTQTGAADAVREPVGALVAPLAEFGRADLAVAGGKGANLGELVRLGLPVPDGFVVTTRAYAMIVERTGLAARIADRLAAGADGAAIRDDLVAATIPDELRSAIAAGYAGLGGGPVAVRSSATAEDLPGAAFAGQQDTFLNVVGEESVLDAVARCWASLWTDRAIAYRRKRGVDSATVRIAVVVQSMADADAAGVMFTANPVTGDRDETVVDASAGLGEAVVSGLVTPDHYVLDRHGAVRDWAPGKREVAIRGTADGGVTSEAEPAEPARLPDAVLRRLADLGASAAAHFGMPQDMEWATVGDRALVLQARPMTALPPPPVRLNPVQRRVGSILLDYLTARPYPLDVTTWMEHGPLRMVEQMAASVGLRVEFTRSVHETEGVVDRFVPPTPHPTPRLLAAPVSLLRRARRYDPARWMEDPRYAEYVQRRGELSGRDLGALPWADLLRMPREVLSLVDYVTWLRVDYLPRVGLALLLLRLVLALTRFGGAMSDLLVSPTTTTACNDALGTLAEQVRDDPALRQAFDELPPDRLLATVHSDPRFAAFDRALGDFLAEYGHRETASPILLSPPTWRDAPETVFGLVKVLADNPQEQVTEDRAGAATRRLLSRPVLRRMPSRVARWLGDARSGVAFREDTHFQFTRPLPLLRDTVLEIGRRLQLAGAAREPFDVFHLKLDEIEGLEDPSVAGEDDLERVRSTVMARAARRDELSGVRLLDTRAVFGSAAGTSDALVSGTPACGGRVTARVRVIRETSEFGALRSGEVLVCGYTNPAWTPLFQRASAVVVDTGGVGSHAAIVAREYGIPAVMGTGTATEVLTDGQLVTVDGDRGTVLAAGDDTTAAGV